MEFLHDFWYNFSHNLFKPLLLFFYMGFLIPLFRVKFEFPKALYQALTIYLLVAIGWHGGEELASVEVGELRYALGFMVIGFVTNTLIGVLAYILLRSLTRLRQVDAATVAGYYGSDSAGTFVTCLGVLYAANITFAPYMPVMLAVMEIPGCLVALYLVSRLRRLGMDRNGNLPGDPEYVAVSETTTTESHRALAGVGHAARHAGGESEGEGGVATAVAETGRAHPATPNHHQHHRSHDDLEPGYYKDGHLARAKKSRGFLDPKVLHEVFLNPGLFLLFGGILIGFVGRLQGVEVTKVDDPLFVALFQGVLCLFLLEMGMTACQRLKDLKTGGLVFVGFGVLAPILFACIGICVAHAYSLVTGHPFEIGTYALFAVLCAAASYIAVPAVQRMAIPEASPTLPLAASLGLTFTFNVTVGIPLYIELAKGLTRLLPVGA